MTVNEILGYVTSLLGGMGLMPFVYAFLVMSALLAFVARILGNRD